MYDFRFTEHRYENRANQSSVKSSLVGLNRYFSADQDIGPPHSDEGMFLPAPSVPLLCSALRRMHPSAGEKLPGGGGRRADGLVRNSSVKRLNRVNRAPSRALSGDGGAVVRAGVRLTAAD